MNYYLAPSLLSADFAQVGNQLKTLEQADVPYLHLDIMDGMFVPNISFGLPVVQSIRKVSKMKFDVHLMITEPEKYVERFQKAGADLISFHIEAAKNPADIIQNIKKAGTKAAITLKPATPLSEIEPFLPDLDMVLVMTVEPGFGGQKFMTDQLEKIKQLSQWKAQKGYTYDIEVDGGITQDNVKVVLDAGANVIVAGSAVFGQPDIGKAAKGFLDIFKEYE